MFPLREQGTLDSTAQGALLGHDSSVLPVACARPIARDPVDLRDRLLLPAPPEFARYVLALAMLQIILGTLWGWTQSTQRSTEAVA
jgi:hypothetical protein